jgi:hypothetical protein
VWVKSRTSVLNATISIVTTTFSRLIKGFYTAIKVMLVSVLKLSYLLTPNFNYTCMFHWFVLYKYTVILKFKIEGALEC